MGWTANWWTVGVQGVPFHCTLRLQASLRAGTGEAHWKINPSSIQQHEQHYTWFMDRITPINYLHVRGMGCAVVQTPKPQRQQRHQDGTMLYSTVRYVPTPYVQYNTFPPKQVSRRCLSHMHGTLCRVCIPYCTTCSMHLSCHTHLRYGTRLGQNAHSIHKLPNDRNALSSA